MLTALHLLNFEIQCILQERKECDLTAQRKTACSQELDMRIYVSRVTVTSNPSTPLKLIVKKSFANLRPHSGASRPRGVRRRDRRIAGSRSDITEVSPGIYSLTWGFWTYLRPEEVRCSRPPTAHEKIPFSRKRFHVYCWLIKKKKGFIQSLIEVLLNSVEEILELNVSCLLLADNHVDLLRRCLMSDCSEM
ncbi:hypothetical protein AVEN_22420-1 [Araneus ventricosus]|uniref:Uncharacterized protein n=1 Tax=Araneus ventricosus TaxID=182803 RepID=A0A4Y2GKN5_ARAVE|nr:hypothetical protein AVEN_22420-1 [Araneus ventricosus]